MALWLRGFVASWRVGVVALWRRGVPASFLHCSCLFLFALPWLCRCFALASVVALSLLCQVFGLGPSMSIFQRFGAFGAGHVKRPSVSDVCACVLVREV